MPADGRRVAWVSHASRPLHTRTVAALRVYQGSGVREPWGRGPCPVTTAAPRSPTAGPLLCPRGDTVHTHTPGPQEDRRPPGQGAARRTKHLSLTRCCSYRPSVRPRIPPARRGSGRAGRTSGSCPTAVWRELVDEHPDARRLVGGEVLPAVRPTARRGRDLAPGAAADERGNLLAPLRRRGSPRRRRRRRPGG